MTTMKFWVIRHTPTGHYIPEPNGREGRGGSHVEPVAVGDGVRARLFITELGAKRALTAWLMGKVLHSAGYDEYVGEYWEKNDLLPVPSRKRDEMDIISVELALP